MLNKVTKTIQDNAMLTAGETVCVALSGGADSVCLALVLKKLGYNVFCVHVNHNLRGEESLRDEAFCVQFCKAQNLALFVESVDVKAYCAENKCSVEEGARHLRYQALNKHCNGKKLATAHNLNDCLETTLFNLTRGCGIKGLLGIPPKRDNIIRPLLSITREEIESYLSNVGQPFVTDSTNLTDDCSRNIIRHNVLPQLLKLNGGLYKTYESELSVWREAEEHLNALAHSSLESSRTVGGYDLSDIKDEAVLSRTVSLILSENGISPNFERVCAVKDIISNGGKINIQKQVYISSHSGKLTVTDSALNGKLFVECTLSGEIAVGGKKAVITQLSSFDISSYNKNSLKWLLDADKLIGQTAIRSYNGNEKIKLFGNGFTSVVKKLFAKIPPNERNSRLVVSDECGAVFVEGFGVAERACVTPQTTCAIRIEFEN